MSAAVALVDMSSSLDDRLLWFAKTVTSVRRNADVASMLKQTLHGKHLTEKKKKKGKKRKRAYRAGEGSRKVEEANGFRLKIRRLLLKEGHY
ncbi:LOW QUALITY PROTEIN: hypothetical protein OSB04_005385 [Centaurea solstitialis]|uniref:Uncharacterized protein n=1 Tax=Centaurea solstitialis TaxID=347529 RepID=A0AA38WPM0_9ASTR|nr:LOW QUALITY PROTEIN: hypothetical protein OSB04_005385 [Centaurea solstitialis]